MIDHELAAELAAMAAEDQRIRGDVMRTDGGTLTFAQSMEWARIDVGNTDRLKEIVAAYGWPGWVLVGKDGAHDAWLLAQHAGRQLDFQRQALRLLADAVARDDADPRDLAYLTDRVRMHEGREQLFGTQMYSQQGGPAEPWPIEDPDGLDARRAELGLEPFADYLAEFRSD